MLQRKSQKKYLSLKGFVLFFFLILLFLMLLTILSTVFVIEKIEDISKKHLKVIRGSELLVGKNILILKKREIQKNLQELNPNTKNLIIKIIYPNKIQIDYELEDAIAYIKANAGYLYISDSSKILKKSKNLEKNSKLTEMLFYQQFDYITTSIGSSIDFLDIKYSLDVLKKVKDYDFEIVSIDISRPSMIRLNLIDSVIIFTSEKNIDGQINKLEKIIKQFKVEGNSFSLLDLRFDKPILKLK